MTKDQAGYQPPGGRIDETSRDRLLKLATNASVAVAGLLVFIKAIAWAKTGSVAMLGSLLDSLLDTAASIINLIFVRSALRPADTEHRLATVKRNPSAACSRQ